MFKKDNIDVLYRPSATVIIAAKSSAERDDYNYKILFTQRTPETALTKDHYVFPGGVHDKFADDDRKWLKLFHKFGVTGDDLQKLCLTHLPNRPELLMDNNNLARDISLRITAIRETFEETGILLCLTKKEMLTRRTHNQPKCGKAFKLAFGVTDWQQRIHKNPNRFLKMCHHFFIIPDLWSLHEWSAWRSPANALKKYDTIFYITFLTEEPTLYIEPSEVANAMWCNPLEVLTLFKNTSIWLPGSLFYETCRLKYFKNWKKLLQFANKRSSNGCTLLSLAFYNCNDYVVGVLPGDDYFYPRHLFKHVKCIELPLSAAEFATRTENLHRMHCINMHTYNVIATIPPLDGHITSSTQNDIGIPISKSKL